MYSVWKRKKRSIIQSMACECEDISLHIMPVKNFNVSFSWFLSCQSICGALHVYRKRLSELPAAAAAA